LNVEDEKHCGGWKEKKRDKREGCGGKRGGGGDLPYASLRFLSKLLRAWGGAVWERRWRLNTKIKKQKTLKKGLNRGGKQLNQQLPWGPLSEKKSNGEVQREGWGRSEIKKQFNRSWD